MCWLELSIILYFQEASTNQTCHNSKTTPARKKFGFLLGIGRLIAVHGICRFKAHGSWHCFQFVYSSLFQFFNGTLSLAFP